MAIHVPSGRVRGVPVRILGVAIVLAIVAIVLALTDDRLDSRDDRPADEAGAAQPIPIVVVGPHIDPAGPTAPTPEGTKAAQGRGEPPQSGPTPQRREGAVRPGPATASGAPASGLVSDFDGDAIASAFGSGWAISTDTIVGGKSTVRYELVPGGAEGSKGALRISGFIEDRPLPRWAGAQFSPGARMMAPANLSARKAITFRARGDGRTYAIMIFSLSGGFSRAEKTFVAAREWGMHRFELKDFEGCNVRTVMAVFLGGGPDTGPFELLIDDVRIE